MKGDVAITRKKVSGECKEESSQLKAVLNPKTKI